MLAVEDAVIGRRVQLTCRPLPVNRDGSKARFGTIHLVVPKQGGCLVIIDGFDQPSGWGFSELELIPEVPCPNCGRKNDADARTCWCCGIGVPTSA